MCLPSLGLPGTQLTLDGKEVHGYAMRDYVCVAGVGSAAAPGTGRVIVRGGAEAEYSRLRLAESCSKNVCLQKAKHPFIAFQLSTFFSEHTLIDTNRPHSAPAAR